MCGAILGLCHAFYLYRQIAARYASVGVTGVSFRGLYYSVWTVVLWTFLGCSRRSAHFDYAFI